MIIYSTQSSYSERNNGKIYTDGNIQQTEDNPQKIMGSEKVLCTEKKGSAYWSFWF